MNPTSEDIKDILEAATELNLVFNKNLFIGLEQPTSRNCVTIFDTTGYGDDLGLVTQGYERPSIQILVRSTKYMKGWKLAHDIKKLLHGMNHEQCGDSLYTVIYCTSGPALLEWDNNNNVKFVINFNLQRR